MKKRFFTTILVLMTTLSTCFAIGPTFYYKLQVEPVPVGAGKVYVANEDLDESEIVWKSSWYSTSPLKYESTVPIEAITVTSYLYAQPNDGYLFSHWTKIDDNNQETVFSYAQNTTDLVSTNATTKDNAKTVKYKAYFVEKGLVYPESSDESIGTVTIDNPTNKIGDKVTLTAFPDKLNGKFIGWRRNGTSNLITTNPYTFTVTNTNKGTYTAVFESRNIDTQGIYVYLENVYSNKYLGVTGTMVDTIEDEGNRNLYHSMVLVDKNNKRGHSLPSLVLRVKGTPTGTGGLKGVDIIGQGVSTYDVMGMKFRVEKYDTAEYFLYGTARGGTGYIKDNADRTTNGDMELIGAIRYPNLYNRPDNDKKYRWRFNHINEENLNENYFGALPSSNTAKNGKYYTTMYTAFPYQCLDNVKAYTVDKILESGDVHMVEITNGIVPAYTAVILECTSTEPIGNRLLPLITDPEPLTGTNLLKGEIWLIDGDDVSSYRTPFDPATMRVLSDDKAAFVSVNNKDDMHDNATLEYIANNTCYLDITGKNVPNEMSFTSTNNRLVGDVNDDGLVDIVDITTMVNYILKKPVDVFIFINGDTNEDGIIDVVDLMNVVYIVLHQ